MDILDTLARWLGRPPAHEVVRHDLGWTPALRTPKKPPPVDPSEDIAAFWQWWSEAVPLLHALDTDPPPDSVLAGLDERLASLHRELAWELGPGVAKKHALTVSPDGVSALRSLTAAWKAAAPTGLADWEFHDVRPPVPGPACDLELETSGRVVDGGTVQVGVFDDEDGHRLDVWVHHPILARSNKRNRWRLAFLLVDAALGEERVATWLRTITPSVQPLEQVRDIREAVVVMDLDGLRTRVAQREAEGDPAPPPLPETHGSVQVDPRARRWRHPHFDTRVRVQVPAGRLSALEAQLGTLADRAVPALRRRIADQVEVDLYTGAADPVVAALQAALPEALVSQQWDPGWSLAGR